MSDSVSIHAKSCCSIEKNRISEDISDCFYCSSSYESFHRCLKESARESGKRSRRCLIA